MLRGKKQSKSTRARWKERKNSYNKSYECNTKVSFYLIDLKLECFASVEMRDWESGRRKSGPEVSCYLLIISWQSEENKGEKKR